MIAFALAMTLLAPSEQATDLFPEGGGASYAGEIRDHLRRCGATAMPFSIDDGEIYEGVVITLDEADLEDANVACLANSASLDSVTIAFANARFDEDFRTAHAARPDVKASYDEMLRQQRAWLDERGLLAEMPYPTLERPLSTYAAEVETHCGMSAGALFVADDTTRSLTLMGAGDPSFDQFACALGIVSLGVAEGAELTLIQTGEDSNP